MGHGGEEGGESSERWLVSYADFITLLMVLFVVLYSMGKTDVEKYKRLAESMRSAFTLGGPFALGTLQQGEWRGSNYLYGNAGYLHEVARVLEGVVGRVYVGGWVEHGAVFEHVDTVRPTTNLSGGLIMETAIGPASVMGSVDRRGRYRFYLGLGPLLRR